MRQLLLALSTVLLFNACGDENTNQISYLPDAVGSYSTVNVIADQSVWDIGLENQVAPVLQQEIDGLYNPEAEFNYEKIRSKAFNRLFQRQKFILLFASSPKILKSGVNIKKDVYANGQIIVEVAAPTDEKVMEVFQKNKTQIFNALDKHRTTIIQALAKKENNSKLEQILLKNQNIQLSIPTSYTLAKDTANFNYFVKKGEMKCEKFKHNKCYIQSGIFVYSFPYSTADVFSTKALAAKRDSLTKLYIPAPAILDSFPAYMKTVDKFPIAEEKVNLNGKFAYEIKGWWDVENGTMGGPYVSVATVDEKRNRVIVADGYVFGPNFNKRRFIKELEAVCLSIQPAE